MYSRAGYSVYSSEREPPGVISLFEIMFSDRSDTYMEGQEVKGEVIVELLEDTVIESKFPFNKPKRL